jgi:hypothetical protein
MVFFLVDYSNFHNYISLINKKKWIINIFNKILNKFYLRASHDLEKYQYFLKSIKL